MASESVYAQKKAFIEGQIRRFATTLGPSQEFKAAAASGDLEDNERLSETVIDNAVYKLNLALRKQHRLQYSAQAVRHVSTQLDELYRARINADRETGIQGGESATFLDILSGHADLTDENVISLMPDIWPVQTKDEELQGQYGEALAELQSLSTALSSLHKKQEYYGSLLSLVEQTLGDPAGKVQPNIVTRTGSIAEEFRKMRTLIARIKDRLDSADVVLRDEGNRHLEEQEADLDKWVTLTNIISKVEQDGVYQ